MSFINNYISPTKIDELLIPGGKYCVKIATRREEVEKALKLRFDVFNIELGEGLEESYETHMDEDEFDAQCHHLIVQLIETDEVIGTYRMQDNLMASSGHGFYTAQEFDISSFPDDVLENVVELGRACIHRDHRNGRVLFLLWRGLAKYLQLSGKRYLFGCCSITSQDASEGRAYFEYLRSNNYMHPTINADVQHEFECLNVDPLVQYNGEVKLPQLFRLYMDLGTMVCSPPALDKKFKTIDFLILLDKEALSEQSKALFLK